MRRSPDWSSLGALCYVGPDGDLLCPWVCAADRGVWVSVPPPPQGVGALLALQAPDHRQGASGRQKQPGLALARPTRHSFSIPGTPKL